MLGFGVFSYTILLPREGFPSVSIPTGVVTGSYFVNDKNKVDQDIAKPLAELLEKSDEVEEYEIASGPNFYTAQVTFRDGTKSNDGVAGIQQVASQTLKLPEAATMEFIAIEPAKINNRYSALLDVYEDKDTSYTVLTEKAELVADNLSSQAGVDSAEVLPVVESLIDPSTGVLKQRQTNINKLAIRQNDQINFYPSVTIAITRTDDVDDLKIAQIIEDSRSDIENKNLLSGAKTSITADFAKGIKQQISSLQNNLLGGLAAVILVSLLLISWRAALVIALFIPTVLAVTFTGLGLLGLTLNTITLFAAILTLGLFVDDATIVVESIDAHRSDKASHKTVIKRAISRIGLATVAGTLTTVLVFAPMLSVSGILGDFIKLLPITVILALFVSLIISVTIVPFLSRWIVLGGKRQNLLDRLSVLVPLEKRLAKFLSNLPGLILVNRRKGRMVKILMVELSILAFIGAIIFSIQLPFEIFPQSKDANFLQVNLQFKPGTSIQQASLITDKVDERIKVTLGNELQSVTYLSANERLAALRIELTDYNSRSTSSHELVEKLNQTGSTLLGATIKYTQLDAGPPTQDFPFQMRVFAEGQSLEDLSGAVAKYISETKLEETSVAEVKVNTDATLNRSDQGRFIDILARFETKKSVSENVISLEDKVKRHFDKERLFKYGVNDNALNFDISQENDNAESFSSMGQGVLIAIVVMYLLLVLLFDSLMQPLLILLAVPFGLFGVFFGLYVTNNSLSFFSMLGIMGLIGIAVNNSIMLTEYANQEVENGLNRHQAITNALRDRFRALITTTLTTVVALLPLALSDPFWQPLAYTIIFGIISSSILIILSFPYYYLGLEKIRLWAHERFLGNT